MTTPQNDPSIADGDRLIRGIAKDHITEDDAYAGGWRIGSNAFRPSSPKRGRGMSVSIEKLMKADGKTIEDIAQPKHIGYVAIRAGDVRALGLIVGKTPQPEDPYHGDVWRIVDGEAKDFKESEARTLRKKAVWIIKPSDHVVQSILQQRS